MGYNMYWSGSLDITPEMSTAQLNELESWFAINTVDRIIVDDDLEKLYKDNGWDTYTPWSPIDMIEPSYITFDHEGTHVDPMSFIIAVLMKKFLIPWEKKVSGTIFWDGDEQEDLGCIDLKGDGKIWICNASIVYPEPGSEETTEVTI